MEITISEKEVSCHTHQLGDIKVKGCSLGDGGVWLSITAPFCAWRGARGDAGQRETRTHTCTGTRSVLERSLAPFWLEIHVPMLMPSVYKAG